MHSEDSNRAARESVADGLRRLTDLLLRVEADDPGLDAVAAELDQITRGLDGHGARPAGEDPASGRGNALAPPLDVVVGDDGSAAATVVLGLQYQGPKALVHGGMSALMLSHVAGVVAAVEGEPAVVHELSVRYHRPTPLFTELTVSAVPGDSAGGHVRGTIEADGVTTVSAEARVVPPPNR